jgi:hypothetical protein
MSQGPKRYRRAENEFTVRVRCSEGGNSQISTNCELIDKINTNYVPAQPARTNMNHSRIFSIGENVRGI